MEDFSALFTEAREELQYASESRETTYFNEEVEAAQKCVVKALTCFKELCDGVDEESRNAIMRSNGLKVEQLKQELKQLTNGAH